jgi:hypothetical protein
MIACLLVSILLLSAAQPTGIGVKSGDWAIYQKRFHQEQNGDTAINRDYLWIIELQILSVNGTQLPTRRRIDWKTAQ